jgi:hypothetical protein
MGDDGITQTEMSGGCFIHLVWMLMRSCICRRNSNQICLLIQMRSLRSVNPLTGSRPKWLFLPCRLFHSRDARFQCLYRICCSASVKSGRVPGLRGFARGPRQDGFQIETFNPSANQDQPHLAESRTHSTRILAVLVIAAVAALVAAFV